MTFLYRLIMDPSVNAMRALPAAQAYQIMVYLSFMWTALFCGALGAWVWFDELVVSHALLAFGIVMTGLTFQRASRSKAAAVRLR